MSQKIQTENVLLRKSGKGNYYFRHDGQIVLVNETVASKWDTLDSVTIDEVQYTKRTDESGNLVDEDWSRMEVTGKDDFALTMKKKTMRLEAATQYARAKNESLKVSDLEPSVKAELEELLK
jgi:hypothetical protein